MHVLYTAIEGRSAGFAAVRLDLAARPRARAAPAPTARSRRASRKREARCSRSRLRVCLALVALVFVYLAGHVRAGVAGVAPRRRAAVAGDRRARRRAVRRPPSPVLAARLDHAIDLYRRKHRADDRRHRRSGSRATGSPKRARAPTTCTSTASPTTRSCARRRAARRGSRLQAAARFLESAALTRVVLVSDPYHSARIDAIAHEVGLDAVTSPTRTSPIKGFAALKRMFGETLRVARRPHVRLRAARPAPRGREARSRTRYTLSPPRSAPDLLRPEQAVAHPFGGGVIGNTTGSGPVIGGSSPPPRAGSTVTGTVSSPSPGPVV